MTTIVTNSKIKYTTDKTQMGSKRKQSKSTVHRQKESKIIQRNSKLELVRSGTWVNDSCWYLHKIVSVGIPWPTIRVIRTAQSFDGSKIRSLLLLAQIDGDRQTENDPAFWCWNPCESEWDFLTLVAVGLALRWCRFRGFQESMACAQKIWNRKG